MTDDVRLKRLRWRARRGTKELDVLIGWWLQACWADADAAEQQAFDEMLDVADPDLWDWILDHARAPRADWQAIVDAIRAHHNL